MSETDLDTYALKAAAAAEVAAPDLPYRPPMPRAYRPRIALVGAGGIAAAHLAAYRAAGFDVAVICNRTLARAEARRDEFFPGAEATDDIAGTLARDDIAVVDITPHPAERLPMIEAALAAGKHVLSQKPFVLDLDAGAAALRPRRRARACGSRSTRTAAGRRTSPGCARRCAPG